MLTSATRQPVIRLKEVRLSLAWWPLLTGRIEIGSLVLVEPSLVLERLADGRLRVTGLEAQAAPDPAQQDFNDWLLRQHEMQIVNGELEWVDRVPVSGSTEPERLAVRRVNITLHNEGDRHRLDLRADFPRSLCADCRLSMDFTGRPQRDERWQGEVALQARDPRGRRCRAHCAQPVARRP